MSIDADTDEFRDLLDRWEDLREQGSEPSIEELCRDAPHLVERMREWTRVLSGSEWLSRCTDEATDQTIGEAAPPSAEAKETHRVLGEYTLVAELGAGGMGRVFKAVHRRMNRAVALKLLVPALVEAAESLERFQREIRTLARLHHANIVAVHDAGAADGAHFYVMDLVEGDDLARLVRDIGPMPVEQAVDCVLQTARGLQYAHAEGIVHRDIKPSNLVLDHQGTVKILDLGIARLAPGSESADDLTKTGCVLGTIDYMAPEQAVNTRSADQRADIYSLGCTLWYLLTGRPLYSGHTIMERLVAHRERPLPSLRAACPAAPAWLEAVFHKMIAKKPADRYQSVADVISDLERQAAPRGQRPRIAVIAGALAVLAALAISAWWAAPRLMATRQKPLDLPVKPSWRTTGEFPLLSGVWKETDAKHETLVTVVQHGGDFIATASYEDSGRAVSWRGEGNVSRKGHVTMNLAFMQPNPPDGFPSQACTAVLSPSGHSLEGYTSFEGGRRKFAWKLVEAK